MSEPDFVETIPMIDPDEIGEKSVELKRRMRPLGAVRFQFEHLDGVLIGRGWTDQQ